MMMIVEMVIAAMIMIIAGMLMSTFNNDYEGHSINHYNSKDDNDEAGDYSLTKQKKKTIGKSNGGWRLLYCQPVKRLVSKSAQFFVRRQVQFCLDSLSSE